MRILFDHNVPRQLRRHLSNHDVDVADERGWARFVNGALLDRAEEAAYEVVMTADRSIAYQQNITYRSFGLVVLRGNRWPLVQARIGDILAALDGIRPGEVREVDIPAGPPR